MIDIKTNVALSDLNTMMTKGIARYLIEWEEAHDLEVFFTDENYDDIRGHRIKPIGQGSNLLFVYECYEGVLLKSRARGLQIICESEDAVLLKAGAGLKLDDLISYACNEKFWGIENLSLIPGTVGAAAVQNVGAYGVEFKDVLQSVECFDMSDGMIKCFDWDELDYGYRHSMFKREEFKDRFVVTSVLIKLSKKPAPKLNYGNLSDMVGDSSDINGIREAVIRLRRTKLPEVGEIGSAGSFFKNPIVGENDYQKILTLVSAQGIDVEHMPVYEVKSGKKLSAAWLIDRAGWKGVTMNHAGVWPLHPLVLVNADGYASGRNIVDLAEAIGVDVERKFGVKLNPEVEYIIM